LEDVVAGYYLDFLTIFEHGDFLYELTDDSMLRAQQVLASELFNAKKNYNLHINYRQLEVGHREVEESEFKALVNLFSMINESLGNGYTPDVSVPQYETEDLSWETL